MKGGLRALTARGCSFWAKAFITSYWLSPSSVDLTIGWCDEFAGTILVFRTSASEGNAGRVARTDVFEVQVSGDVNIELAPHVIIRSSEIFLESAGPHP